MKLFTIENYDVVVNPVAWTLKPFKSIKDKYKGDDKRYATTEMAYIYFFASWNSDYSDITDLEERKERILNEVYAKDVKKLKIDEKTEAAIKFFTEKQMTLSMKLQIDAKAAINQVRKYFREVDLLALDDKGKPIHDASKLTNTIEKSATLVAKMAELEEAIKKERQSSSRIKGMDEIGFFEE